MKLELNSGAFDFIKNQVLFKFKFKFQVKLLFNVHVILLFSFVDVFIIIF